MNQAQAHRGPDGKGLFEDRGAEAMLAHVRLAILDLTDAAAQPMSTVDGRYVLVFNGEIYNFRELREDLLTLGCTFKSSGDTEVLLHGLSQQGEGFIHKLNGMFAFAFWDRQERVLLLARDPIGIKPLYYAEPESGTLLFSSEIKALFAYQSLKREPDFIALQEHLAFCHAIGDRTAFKAVKRLLPGHLLKWKERERSYQIYRYWQPTFFPHKIIDERQAAQLLREKIKEATIRQMVSDVPVGAYFSGGLDSSLIVQAATTVYKKYFCGYLISYHSRENQLDDFVEDSPYAHYYADDLGIKLEELLIKPEVDTLWPKLIYHLDEPIADPAAIACYLISEKARKSGTSVLLSGQGGDELFGGYPRYWVINSTKWLEFVPYRIRGLIAGLADYLPGSMTGKLGAFMRRVRRVLQEADKTIDERFLCYCGSTQQAEISAVFDPMVREILENRKSMDDDFAFLRTRNYHGIDRYLDRDLSVYLPNHNLLYTDKMSMAVGIEARVPLLDQELVDMVTPWPQELKVKGLKTKYILRKAAKGVVPDRIIDRRKGGFGAPYRKWLRYDLSEMWNDLMSEEMVKQRGWFDYKAIKSARER